MYAIDCGPTAVKTLMRFLSHCFITVYFSLPHPLIFPSQSFPVMSPAPISPVQEFIAGTAAGAAIVLVGHPFGEKRKKAHLAEHLAEGHKRLLLLRCIA